MNGSDTITITLKQYSSLRDVWSTLHYNYVKVREHVEALAAQEFVDKLKQETSKASLGLKHQEAWDTYKAANPASTVGMEDVCSVNLPDSLLRQRMEASYTTTVGKLVDAKKAEEKVRKDAAGKEATVQEALLAAKPLDRITEFVDARITAHEHPPAGDATMNGPLNEVEQKAKDEAEAEQKAKEKRLLTSLQLKGKGKGKNKGKGKDEKTGKGPSAQNRQQGNDVAPGAVPGATTQSQKEKADKSKRGKKGKTGNNDKGGKPQKNKGRGKAGQDGKGEKQLPNQWCEPNNEQWVWKNQLVDQGKFMAWLLGKETVSKRRLRQQLYSQSQKVKRGSIEETAKRRFAHMMRDLNYDDVVSLLNFNAGSSKVYAYDWESCSTTAPVPYPWPVVWLLSRTSPKHVFTQNHQA